jgi:hypothetical protein
MQQDIPMSSFKKSLFRRGDPLTPPRFWPCKVIYEDQEAIERLLNRGYVKMNVDVGVIAPGDYCWGDIKAIIL